MPQCVLVPDLDQLPTPDHTLPHHAAFYDVHGRADKKRGRSPG